MRLTILREHAESQLRYLWRPVVVVTFAVLLLSCGTSPGSTSQSPLDPSTTEVYLPLTPTTILTQEPSPVIEAETPTPEPTSTATPTQAPAPLLAPAVNNQSGASAQSVQSGNSVVGRVTGYYCSQIEGYPVWDGGGYCGNMASGSTVFSGAAACGYYWTLGQRIEVEGFGEVVCMDRGHLEHTQIDIFFPTNRDLYESGIGSNYRSLTPLP